MVNSHQRAKPLIVFFLAIGRLTKNFKIIFKVTPEIFKYFLWDADKSVWSLWFGLHMCYNGNYKMKLKAKQ